MSSERVKYQTSGHTSNCACTRCRGVGPKNPPTQLLAEVAPSPPQPGDTVLVEAVVGWLSPDGVNAIVTSLENGGDITAGATLVVNVAAIHPAPTAAKKGDHK